MTDLATLFPTAASLPETATIDASPYANRYLLDGEILTWAGESLEVRSPVCLRDGGNLERALVGLMPALTAEESLRALDAARRAWNSGRGEWPTMGVGRRIQHVEDFIEAMGQVREDVVRLLMWEIAKTRKDAETEFDRTVIYLRDTVDELKKMDQDGSRFVMSEGTIGQIRRSPLGVVLCMGPYNYPLNETMTILLPALIMGNTVVSKLPRFGGLAFVPLLEAFRACFPPGVINVIQGDGPTVIGPIMQSGKIDCLAFIGSTRTIDVLKKQHPTPHRLRTISGMAAKNPAVILPDADLDVTVKECVSGALSFNGQRCTALKQLFVHADIAESFVERFAAAVNALKLGMPWEPGVAITPLPEDGKPAYLTGVVEDAVAKGARLVNDGGQADATFFRPAVLYPVTPDMRAYQEEQFGPLVPISTFRDVAEIDSFMRQSPYGQQVAIFGRDPKALAALIDVMVNQVSRINLNTQCRRGPDAFPFTGRKASAEGTLSVHDALRSFSIRALVATSATDANKEILQQIISSRLSSFLTTDIVF
jgi:glyceraldehyde-3-phosphate dehydrogenase (NADP+)